MNKSGPTRVAAERPLARRAEIKLKRLSTGSLIRDPVGGVVKAEDVAYLGATPGRRPAVWARAGRRLPRRRAGPRRGSRPHRQVPARPPPCSGHRAAALKTAISVKQGRSSRPTWRGLSPSFQAAGDVDRQDSGWLQPQGAPLLVPEAEEHHPAPPRGSGGSRGGTGLRERLTLRIVVEGADDPNPR